MAIIKFKVTRLPKRASLKIDAVAVVLNQEYALTQQSQMTCDISDIGVPYDDFGYKLGNDKEIWSPEYKCTINANVENLPITTTSNNYNVALNQVTPIAFTLENQVDRVIITNHNPKYGEFFINGSQAILGKVYMRYDFKNLSFSSNNNVEEQNVVSIINYDKGNKNGYVSGSTISFISTANIASIINSSTTINGVITG